MKRLKTLIGKAGTLWKEEHRDFNEALLPRRTNVEKFRTLLPSNL